MEPEPDGAGALVATGDARRGWSSPPKGLSEQPASSAIDATADSRSQFFRLSLVAYMILWSAPCRLINVWVSGIAIICRPRLAGAAKYVTFPILKTALGIQNLIALSDILFNEVKHLGRFCGEEHENSAVLNDGSGPILGAIGRNDSGKNMTKLTILEFPDPRLRKKAAPVDVVDDTLRQLIDDMFETMYAAPGIGLAATQVDVHKRLLVTDVSPENDQPYALINPRILEKDGVAITEEGCLSVPGYYEEVERANHIRVAFLDRNGDEVEMEAEGLLAVCIQHEMDHLDGKLFVDYLSEAKRSRIRKRLERDRRHHTTAAVL